MSRLRDLRRDLEQALRDAATVTVEVDDDGESVALTPLRQGALGVLWTDFGSELQVETDGGPGGLWEMGRNLDGVALVEALVRAVVDGRVREVSAGDRSLVEVTLADGSVIAETGAIGLRGLLPRPGWKRSGAVTQYEPYEG